MTTKQVSYSEQELRKDVSDLSNEITIGKIVRRSESAILDYIVGYSCLILSAIWTAHKVYLLGIIWLVIAGLVFMKRSFSWCRETKELRFKYERVKASIETKK